MATMADWGPLADRYTSERPRALLALDGGGIRGVLSLEVLLEMERQLATALGAGGAGDDFRLGDFFDYIGGTSTGAIIAAGLARGMRVQELLDFYNDAGPLMFQKAHLLKRLRNFYTADPLKEKLQEVYGADTDLHPEHLRSLLLVVTRNATTDSPWPISTNPRAKYNATDRGDCNLNVPLWQLVRASTAAPVYFPPEMVSWDPDDPSKSFVFVDGGVTAYNNPAFLLYRMATAPEYRLDWPTGERRMMMVSIGPGSAPDTDEALSSSGKNLIANVAGLPGALMYAAQVDQDVNCRSVGRCVHGRPIDNELGDMIPRVDVEDPKSARIPVDQDQGRDFLYARFEPELSTAGLAELGLEHIDADDVRTLDAVGAIPELREVGRAVAREVDMTEHFGPFLDAWRSATGD